MHQNLSINFIKETKWSFNVWIFILGNQNITDNDLIELLKCKTLKFLISKYAKMSGTFIENNYKLLDFEIITEFQPLDYEFVRTHIELVNMELLKKNEKINFLIFEVNKENLINSGVEYICLKDPNYNKVLFI